MRTGRVYFILMTVYYSFLLNNKKKNHQEEALIQSSAGAAYLGQSWILLQFHLSETKRLPTRELEGKQRFDLVSSEVSATKRDG